MKSESERLGLSNSSRGGMIVYVSLVLVIFSSTPSILSADDFEAVQRRIIDTVNRCEDSVVCLYLSDIPEKRINLSPFRDDGGTLPEKYAPGDSAYRPRQPTLGVVVKNRFVEDEKMVLCRISQLFINVHESEDLQEFSNRTIYCRFLNENDKLTTTTLSIYSADPRSDLAILRINFTQQQLESLPKPVSLGDARRLKRGSLLVRFGGPKIVSTGKKPTVHHQLVNTSNRGLIEYTEESSIGKLVGKSRLGTFLGFGDFLWTGSDVETADSSGLLFNLDGNLVGLETTTPFVIRSRNGVVRSFPFNKTGTRILDRLLAGKEMEYGFLGVVPRQLSEVDSRTKTGGRHGTACIAVDGVISGSPAESSNLKVDDLIIEINGRSVQTMIDFQREVLLAAPGKDSELKVWNHRRRRIEKKTIKFWKTSPYQPGRIVAPVPTYPAWRGIQYDFSTSRKTRQADGNLRECLPAVLVTSIAENSLASATGLRAGDYISHVDGKPVRTPQEFRERTTRLKGTASLSIIGGSRIRVGE